MVKYYLWIRFINTDDHWICRHFVSISEREHKIRCFFHHYCQLYRWELLHKYINITYEQLGFCLLIVRNLPKFIQARDEWKPKSVSQLFHGITDQRLCVLLNPFLGEVLTEVYNVVRQWSIGPVFTDQFNRTQVYYGIAKSSFSAQSVQRFTWLMIGKTMNELFDVVRLSLSTYLDKSWRISSYWYINVLGQALRIQTEEFAHWHNFTHAIGKGVECEYTWNFAFVVPSPLLRPHLHWQVGWRVG